jgi:hypothetical protein
MMRPMYDVSFGIVGFAVVAVWFILIVLGFAIIRWITRNPEDGSDHWRSHRH